MHTEWNTEGYRLKAQCNNNISVEFKHLHFPEHMIYRKVYFESLTIVMVTNILSEQTQCVKIFSLN
jgi:hypothetical protein